MGQEESTLRHSCPNCKKIASIVRDWQAFTNRDNKYSYQLGGWEDFQLHRALGCGTCKHLDVLLDEPYGWNYSVSIFASRNREDLVIRLREKGGDPEDIRSKSYELKLLPPIEINPSGLHFIEANPHWISIERIRRWIQQCDSTHEATCDESQFQASETSNSVIFIDVQTNSLVRGLLTEKYIALSYVWGQQQNIFQTKLSNIKELLQNNSLSEAWERIPATIQDAIILARNLDIRFLWVDRLCIVQDDLVSIQSNIAQMASIYARAYFTLIATDGDSETGIWGVPGGSKERNLPQELVKFDDLSFLVIHKDVFYGEEDGLTEEYDFRGSYESEVNRRWHTRAWTFQERTVSKRCLIFNNNTISFECNQGIYTELLSSPQHSFTAPISRNRKFGNPHWRLERRLWPDTTQYSILSEGFSRRKLTYANDGLKAFSAILQSLNPSFPGGFFFAMPEFIFDVALLWKFTKPRNGRRDMFPSWSWVAWEGEGIESESGFEECWGPVFTNDELRIFRRPLNTWKKKNTMTGTMEVINNTYYIWSNAKEDEIGNLPGWKSSQQPENFTLKELGFSGSHRDSHVAHPFPITNTLLTQPLPSTTWEPFLYARVKTATFRFAGQPDPNWGKVGLMDNFGEGVGNLNPHDSGHGLELLGTMGRECCLMAVCEGSVPKWSQFIGDIHFSTSGSNYSANNLVWPRATIGMPFKWVDVLWVEWNDGIAYRRGVGRVWFDAWERADPKEVDIILG